MQLNKNSLSARLYRMFYNKYEMPKSICPYFWKLVIMWICIVPYFILTGPSYLYDRDEDLEDFSSRMFLSLFIYGCILGGTCVVLFVYGLFVGQSSNIHILHLQHSGLAICLTTAFVFLCYLIYLPIKTNRDRKQHRKQQYIFDSEDNYILNPDYVEYVEKPNFIIQFIKDKYNKHCTKIDWK